jgi:hypothetical protein
MPEANYEKHKRMNDWVFSFVLTACLVFASGVQAQESLSFPVTKWEFGKTGQNDKKSHLFKFVNKGKNPLKITQVTPSCGCTAAVVGSGEIKPEGKGSIKVSFNPIGLAGHHESTVTVKADDGSEVLLTVSAEVEAAPLPVLNVTPLKPVFKINAREVNLGRIKEGMTAQYKLIVENAGDGDLFLINLNSAGEGGLPLSHKPIGKGKKVEITFFYNANDKGPIKDSVLIQTNDPVHPNVKIKLKGFVE